MKAIIQSYGLIIIFSMFLFIIPQVFAISMVYRSCNSTASTVVEILDVSEGLNQDKNTMQRINRYMEKVPKIELELVEEELTDGYKMYRVTCSSQYKIRLLGIEYEIRATKNTRRVIY